jgi:YidC/Oxa1 family membrane protein insertase
MEKRVLLAFVLSTTILALWYYFFAPAPPPTAPQKPQPTARVEREVEREAAPVSTPVERLPEREIRIETPLWTAVFTTRGAVARSWNIHHRPNGQLLLGADRRPLELIPQERDVIERLGRPFALRSHEAALDRELHEATYAPSTEEAVLRIGRGETRSLAFTYENSARGLRIRKTFTFFGDRYDFHLSISAEREGRPPELSLVLGPNFGDQSIRRSDTYTKTPPIAILRTQEKTARVSAEKVPKEPPHGPILWAGVEDNYFALVAIPKTPAAGAHFATHQRKETVEEEEITRRFIAVSLPVKEPHEYTVFAGPKDPKVLAALDAQLGGVALEEVINYGFFSSVVKPLINWVLFPALQGVHRLTGNYGVGIVLVTLVLNLFFYPLRRSSTIRMRKASALQPKMRELQEKMKGLKKNDPRLQELQMEQLRLMKEANPLAGCLPLLLQLPIFWAMFILLTVSLDVRQAPFVAWIDDLSSPDRWHVLPILMCASMIASTLLTPTPSTDPAQRVQRFMMAYLMPILLTYLFFWRAPSGLVLYWMVSNLVGIGQQLLINRTLGTLPLPAEAEKEPRKRPQVSAKS